MSDIISRAANIVEGANPPFTAEDFRALMPAFTPEIAPDGIVEMYVEMAHSVVRQARWDSLWKEGMRLFVAHFLTLFIESTPAPEAGIPGILNAGTLKGTRTAKSVGEISVSYDASAILNDLQGYGAWKLTAYGAQYITFAKAINRGGMFVR